MLTESHRFNPILSCSVEQIFGEERKLYHIETSETMTSSYRYHLFFSDFKHRNLFNNSNTEAKPLLLVSTETCLCFDLLDLLLLPSPRRCWSFRGRGDETLYFWEFPSDCFWDGTFLPLRLHFSTLLFLSSATCFETLPPAAADLWPYRTRSDGFKASTQRLLRSNVTALKTQKGLIVNLCLVCSLLLRSALLVISAFTSSLAFSEMWCRETQRSRCHFFY